MAHSSGGSVPILRDYQVEQLAAIERALLRDRSTLVSAATGTGKTISIAELTRRQRVRSKRVRPEQPGLFDALLAGMEGVR
jgi:Rad3-related DNA helicase